MAAAAILSSIMFEGTALKWGFLHRISMSKSSVHRCSGCLSILGILRVLFTGYKDPASSPLTNNDQTFFHQIMTNNLLANVPVTVSSSARKTDCQKSGRATHPVSSVSVGVHTCKSGDCYCGSVQTVCTLDLPGQGGFSRLERPRHFFQRHRNPRGSIIWLEKGNLQAGSIDLEHRIHSRVLVLGTWLCYHSGAG
eukprot:6437957-Amphidinium_carterae.1